MSASDASSGLAGVSRGRSSLRGDDGPNEGGGDDVVAEVAGKGVVSAGETTLRETPLTATPSEEASTPSAAAVAPSATTARSRGFERGALAGASAGSVSAFAFGAVAAAGSLRRADGGGSLLAVPAGAGLDETGLSMFCAGEAIWIARGRSGTARSIPPEGVERRGVFGEGEAGDKGAGELSHTLEALGIRP